VSVVVRKVGAVARFFFFQAEDGIRDWSVTGVQTCALPISRSAGEECRSFLAGAAGFDCASDSGGAAVLAAQVGGAGADDAVLLRSGERRVGEEGRSGGGAEDEKKRGEGGRQ